MSMIERLRAKLNPDTPVPDLRSPLELALIDRLRPLCADEQAAAAPVRLHLRFTGTVQGVGFRWTNQGLARERGLTGWVKNLDDGSVEMEIQGTPGRIIMHLDKLHESYRRLHMRIWLEEEHGIPLREAETSFEVTF